MKRRNLPVNTHGEPLPIDPLARGDAIAARVAYFASDDDGRPDGRKRVTRRQADDAGLCGSCGRAVGERHAASCRHEH